MNLAQSFVDQVRKEKGSFFISRLFLKVHTNPKQLEDDAQYDPKVLDALKKAAQELGYQEPTC